MLAALLDSSTVRAPPGKEQQEHCPINSKIVAATQQALYIKYLFFLNKRRMRFQPAMEASGASGGRSLLPGHPEKRNRHLTGAHHP